MAQIIKIQLIPSLIINSVKNETYQSAQLTKADNDKLVSTAYHGTAGDEQYHEKMLERAMFSQVEKLKTWLSEYIAGTGSAADDPLQTIEEQNDNITILLKVSDRFVKGYVKTLARLGQKYVEDRMIHLWWAPIDEKRAEFYAKIAIEDLEGIRRCFNKTAPQAPEYNFPDNITIQFPVLEGGNPSVNGNVVPADTLMSYPYIIAVGEETEISYTLSCRSGKMPKDDIIVRADDGCCMPCLDEGGQWQLRGIQPGMTIITLQSRHDDMVFARFAMRVTE